MNQSHNLGEIVQQTDIVTADFAWYRYVHSETRSWIHASVSLGNTDSTNDLVFPIALPAQILPYCWLDPQ